MAAVELQPALDIELETGHVCVLFQVGRFSPGATTRLLLHSHAAHPVHQGVDGANTQRPAPAFGGSDQQQVGRGRKEAVWKGSGKTNRKFWKLWCNIQIFTLLCYVEV